MAKCTFFNQQMEYLGHIISREGIRKDPKKLRAIENVRTSETKTQVRSFLGKINYYAKFMPLLSKVAWPLAKLTGSNAIFRWTEQEQSAFEALKQLVIQEVVLAFPDVNKPYFITTDASDYAIGAVLAQEDETTGVHRPISYLSKALDETQSRYSVTEKELYAIMFSSERFRPYIYGRSFTVFTDHRALIWLCGKRNPSGRLGRWCNIMNQYSQGIKFIEGKHNRVADCLSRAPFIDEPEDLKDPPEKDGFNANPCLSEDLKRKVYEEAGLEMKEACFFIWKMLNPEEDTEEYTPLLTPELWSQIQEGIPNNVERSSEGIWVIKGTSDPQRSGILWVPPLYRRDVLKSFHKGPMNAHPSAAKMLYAMRDCIQWKGMTADIQDYVNKCGRCQLYRAGGYDKPELISRGTLSYPMQRISLDILSLEKIPGRSSPYVLVIIDEFTKYAEAYPIRHQDATTVANKMVNNFISRYGIPEEIITDCGGCFLSNLFLNICKQLQIKKLNANAYHPQGNGSNE